MATPIGKRGKNPGPGKTNIAGTKAGKNLGSKTTGKTGTQDYQRFLTRARINPGPGGTQRP